jgi:hypothetical protein
MNPALAQLSHEAGITVTAELEKFAELIVKECAIVANEIVEEIEGVNYGVGRILKNRFGVTE